MLLGLLLAAVVGAAPTAQTGISLPLRAPRAPLGDDADAFAVARGEHRRALAKYGYGRQKRDIDLKGWGYGYTVSVQVGTPPQTFDVMPDTGSYDFWLIGACDNTTECGDAKVYRTATSSSFQTTDMEFQAGPYVDGGVQRGMWGSDQVRVGQQAVYASVGVSNETLNWRLAMDGIMGFAPGATSIHTLPWWFLAVAEWTDKQFGMHLGRVPPNIGANKAGAAGYGDLTLGGVNHALFTGEIVYYPLLKGPQSTHWEISMRVVVGGKSVGSDLPALIDSGTTLVIGPAAYVEAFYEALPTLVLSVGGGQYVYKAAPLGAGLNFGGETYLFDDDDLCHLRGSKAWFAANGVDLPEDGDWCLGGVTGQGSLSNSGNVDTGDPAMLDFDFWIVGITFMKNVYTAFRAEPPAVGFAQLSPESNKKYAVSSAAATPTGRVPVATVSVVSGAGKIMPSVAVLVLGAALVLAL
ncbi:hypothetical protein CcaverHIS002_0600820 [Cutaneotrichosporon cavernicola]|uniref:Peptidase A1 domain-containing protein n=1 Tax=Cutaneotrichosporon cavernicola TaxID=279322 RepID=A0AA48QWK1_9TREE|nr:uncharacterized protein CcaverHIS019_0500910 [Cutaneotrichosporon cavernicola]BEI85795.1 hypothetical protein CcaverHIS002_0600820 [Cutaneotrichosporon cavernicola]BEI92463.1 hypothetical protein CcaverHIS019_0500910 [Cutaneotrichosporon cavernicola]BEJ00235.1 hypothetical protein CcaverHIS631_0500920 [Cutaneotrichosporon cavernicola]BEJ08006.1 hypothetical protein CcaverHIS641_0500910 [Cutaneotrichosporon cavernicola]